MKNKKCYFCEEKTFLDKDELSCTEDGYIYHTICLDRYEKQIEQNKEYQDLLGY